MVDVVLMEIINEHLPYEIDMLRSTYLQVEKLLKAPDTAERKVMLNALLEAFCVHARSTIDFFSNNPGPSKNPGRMDAIASEFTAGYTPIDPSREPLKTIRDIKVNKQIFHLTKQRTIIEADKFDVIKDGSEVLKIIEPAIERFKNCLTPDFRSHFRCNTQPTLILSALPVASATNAVQSITGLFGPIVRP